MYNNDKTILFIINVFWLDFEDSLIWLKNQCEPESMLHKLWTETSLYRLKSHKNENMMNIYPALKKPTGHFLVSISFDPVFK